LVHFLELDRLRRTRRGSEPQKSVAHRRRVNELDLRVLARMPVECRRCDRDAVPRPDAAVAVQADADRHQAIPSRSASAVASARDPTWMRAKSRANLSATTAMSSP